MPFDWTFSSDVINISNLASTLNKSPSSSHLLLFEAMMVLNTCLCDGIRPAESEIELKVVVGWSFEMIVMGWTQQFIDPQFK